VSLVSGGYGRGAGAWSSALSSGGIVEIGAAIAKRRGRLVLVVEFVAHVPERVFFLVIVGFE
jgi:hypothetical protein